MSSTYLLERAWVDGAVHSGVLVTVDDGVFVEVSVFPAHRGSPRRTGETVTEIPGLSVPGLANTHSHAFHRALRGRTQRERGTFWTWREQMYAVAGRLDPDSYFALARATYREMAAAGITCVGEFHYLHHQPDGTPYDEPTAMGDALIAAAGEAGIRITLLDTLYLSSGFGAAPEGVQRRYSDGSARAWLERKNSRPPAAHAVLGSAVHSVRAVPVEELAVLRDAVIEGAVTGPVHVHLSEQVAENEQCLAAYGVTPTRLLADAGLLGPNTTAVHATHLAPEDIELLGRSGTYAGFCPTTERDLGDGIGPSRRLHEAGCRLTLGSDSHAVIDPFEEMRAVELDERLATRERGHWSAAELLAAATHDGHASLGFPDAGRIAVGQRADLVTVDTASPRTAGTGAGAETLVFAATAEDVRQVMVDGRVIMRHGEREDVGRELDAAISTLGEAR